MTECDHAALSEAKAFCDLSVGDLESQGSLKCEKLKEAFYYSKEQHLQLSTLCYYSHACFNFAFISHLLCLSQSSSLCRRPSVWLAQSEAFPCPTGMSGDPWLIHNLV